MSRLAQTFHERKKKALLMPYTTGGFPDMDGCRKVMRSFITGGADIIELGIPFSDPLADGPVVQASAQRALEVGVNSDDVLQLVSEFSNEIPVVLLVYYNGVYSYGQERFIAAAAAAGVDGLIVPDLPVDEGGDFITACQAEGIDPILMVAPTTPDVRIAMVAAKASGFIYCVSVTGVTGARTELSDSLPDFLARVRSQTGVPLAVGFGVSNPEQARKVSQYADGVIIGSRLIKMISDADDIDSACVHIERFLAEVNGALEG